MTCGTILADDATLSACGAFDVRDIRGFKALDALELTFDKVMREAKETIVTGATPPCTLTLAKARQ